MVADNYLFGPTIEIKTTAVNPYPRGSMENPYRAYCKRVGPDGSLPPCHCKGDFCVAGTTSKIGGGEP